MLAAAAIRSLPANENQFNELRVQQNYEQFAAAYGAMLMEVRRAAIALGDAELLHIQQTMGLELQSVTQTLNAMGTSLWKPI